MRLIDLPTTRQQIDVLAPLLDEVLRLQDVMLDAQGLPPLAPEGGRISRVVARQRARRMHRHAEQVRRETYPRAIAALALLLGEEESLVYADQLVPLAQKRLAALRASAYAQSLVPTDADDSLAATLLTRRDGAV